MPNSRTRRFRRTTRLALILVVIIAALAAWLFVSLGRLLHHEDPLQKADVIFVLSGSRVERAAEAAELYKEGWAPQILLSRQISEGAEAVLRQRGIPIPSEIDLQRDVLVAMGVPAGAIDHIEVELAATATESDYLSTLARQRQWRRIIVVTSKLHTARAGLTMGRRFAGSGTEIIMRGSRYDTSNIDRWWHSRAELRFVLFEAQKMLAYRIGLGD